MNHDRIIQAYEAVSNPEASVLRKAEGYDTLLRELFNIQVNEHKGVRSPLLVGAGNKSFLQSLCTRLSKLMAKQSQESGGDGDGENADDSKEADNNSKDASNNGSESADDSDTKNADAGNTDEKSNEMSKRFKESGKSVEDFIEELRQEGLNSEGTSDVLEEFTTVPSKPGVGSTPLDRPAGKRSIILEALISKQWCISTEDKRNYKKFLPQVWINPVQPWKIKQNEIVEKPLVMFCGDSGGYSHQKMISALLALPESVAKTFDAENTCLSEYGKYEGKRVHFSKLPKYNSVLVFTNGCNPDQRLITTIKDLINNEVDVKIYTMFNEGCTCGCATFPTLAYHGITVHYNLEV